jgi:hypothetical protein
MAVLSTLGPSAGLVPIPPDRPFVPTAGPSVGTGGPFAPATPGDGIGRILVTTSDPGVVPNDGLMTNLTGFRVDPFPNASAFQIGAEEVLGSYLAVFGLFQNSPLGPVPFFSVFNNTTGRTVYQINESYAHATPGEAFDFALQHANGTNWTLRLDGQLFDGSFALATFDFGVPSATDAAGIGFSVISLATGEVVPPMLEVPTVFGVHRADGWYLPRNGLPTYIGDPAVAWGIAGASQSGTIFPGEITTGTSLAPVANGTSLWAGAPASGTLGLTADPTETAGGATSRITVALTGVSAGRSSSVPLALRSSQGGGFVDPFPSTDTNGSVTTAYLAPNRTAPVTDRLFAVPRILGLAVAAGSSVSVVPAMQILLAAVDPPSLSPGGSATVELRATSLNGAPVPGMQLALFAAGAGSVAPEQGVTDGAGSLSATVSLPRTGSSVTITVVVTTPGFWGSLRLPVQVSPPPPSLEARLLGWLPWVLVTVVAVVLALTLYRRWPPKRPLPALDVRRLVARGPISPPGAAPTGEPPPTLPSDGPSRTLPSADTP